MNTRNFGRVRRNAPTIAGQKAPQLVSEMACGSLSPDFFVRVRFPIVPVFLADVLPVVIIVPVQSIHHKGVGSYPAHLFIDVLAKVGYIQNATAIVEVCINQVFPKAFEQG